jgi:hypothetical protein
MKRLVGERKALAAAVMAFWGILYMFNALMGAGGLGKVMAALASVYGLAFLGIVAGYFWARWFAAGLSLFGVIMGALGLWQMGPEFQVMLILLSHGAAGLMMWGDSMAEAFDGQPGWKQKLSMDEHSVNRLGNAVTRLGVSLPMVLIWALAPKAGGMAVGAAALGLLATAGLIRMRTWGVFAMVGAAGLLMGSAVVAPDVGMATSSTPWIPITGGAPVAVLAAGLLLAGALPFFGPIRRFLAAR